MVYRGLPYSLTRPQNNIKKTKNEEGKEMNIIFLDMQKYIH